MISRFVVVGLLLVPIVTVNRVNAQTSSVGSAEAASDATSLAASLRGLEEQLAAPFFKLADALEKSGRATAAGVTRAWLPKQRDDARLVFFSQLTLDAPHESLSEEKVTEAFVTARRVAGRIALSLAKEAARADNAELAYHLLWRSLRENPEDPKTRSMLGLRSGNSGRVSVRPGRDAPAILQWPARSFLVANSQHFRVYSTASRRETEQLAEDLERYFDVWGQIFWPQWTNSASLCQRIADGTAVAPPYARFEVVLFRDRESYLRLVAGDNPGANQSTGFYSPQHKVTLLFAGEGADVETRYHEITHQLLQEGCGNVVSDPGHDSGFWMVEGIATYMESVRFFSSFATVGGWEAERLQYARARWLAAGEVPSLEELFQEGQEQVQSRDDLRSWYSITAAYVHLLMDQSQFRSEAQRVLSAIYQGRASQALLTSPTEGWDSALIDFLQLAKQTELTLYPGSFVRSICLTRTKVRRDSILKLGRLENLHWLDLSYLPVDSEAFNQLVGNGTEIRQLNLERTQVDNAITATVSAQRAMEECDLSFTRVGDELFEELSGLRNLQTLWLTGSQVTDASIPAILRLRGLESLDVQRTGITEDGLSQLRQARPNLDLNPLRLIAAP